MREVEWWAGACDENQTQVLFLGSFSESSQAGVAAPALSSPLGPKGGSSPGTAWGKKKKSRKKIEWFDEKTILPYVFGGIYCL